MSALPATVLRRLQREANAQNCSDFDRLTTQGAATASVAEVAAKHTASLLAELAKVALPKPIFENESEPDPEPAPTGRRVGSRRGCGVSDTERDIENGPKMRELNPRQQAFVCALFDAPRKDGRIIWAARVAGYGTPTSTNKSLSVIGSRLNVSDKIQAAIAEESQRRLRSLSPTAVQALENLLANPEHRDHARGIGMVLDRADPLQTTHNVVVENKTPREFERATKAVLARIEELARRAGLPALPPPIDAEFAVVSEEAAE
jgi:hypothetical protein